jgi:hypothetical protein
MTRSILTPLQLTACAGLLESQGIKSPPVSLVNSIDAFESLALFAALGLAIDTAATARLQDDKGSWCSPATLAQLQTLGSGTQPTPALGNSVPAQFTNLPVVNSPSGLSGLITQAVNFYLGTNSITQFAQNFMAVSGYISIANDFITSTANAQQYLGPTYTNLNNLISGDITRVSTDLSALALDLQRQGQLWDLSNLELYGTPAGLLQQISSVGRLIGTTVPPLESALVRAGLTTQDIADLVNDNRVSWTNPTGLSQNQFDTLQKIAYTAMTTVSGADAEYVTRLLDVTLPGMVHVSDLLDPVKTFPSSYATLTTPTPAGAVNIFNSDGTVPSSTQSTVDQYLPVQSGCDELGKIIPPGTAVANKAIQVALSQIPNIASVTLPELANTIQQSVSIPWNPQDSYLPNDLVATGIPGAPGYQTQLPGANVQPQYYRAQQLVPENTPLTDTEYWQPVALPGISSLAGLDQILAQTATLPVPQSTVDYFEQTLANGSGPGGTLTMLDMLGTALDHNDLSTKFAQATQLVQQLHSLDLLTVLTDIYQRMQSVAQGLFGNPESGAVEIPAGPAEGVYETAFPNYAGDLALRALVAAADNEIQVIAADPAAATILTDLNTVWGEIAQSLSKERALQLDAGIDYFETVAANRVSIMAFVGNLPNYAEQVAPGQTADFLEQIADRDTVSGQAIVGAMRQARNQQQLDTAGIFSSAQVPADLSVEPAPAVIAVR